LQAFFNVLILKKYFFLPSSIELDALLEESWKEREGLLTRAQIEEQLAIPRITTNYWLNKLKDKQQIIREGSGRNTRYVVCLPESEKPPVED
jgi:Fic family protein